jgi:hypothetical protein
LRQMQNCEAETGCSGNLRKPKTQATTRLSDELEDRLR